MKTKETFLKIDPPSGWKYGFPKAVTQEQYKEIKNLKQWCIDNGYPKEEADSYGDYFYIQINGDLSFMNENKSTKEQHIAWWNKLKYDSPVHLEFYAKKYFQRDWDTLTGREIEEIWLKETQNHTNDSMGKSFISSIESQNIKKPNEKEYIQKVGRVNRKQFKQFDESLHKAYLNKFSDEDKFKAFISNLNELSEEIQFNAFLATLKKMNLDSETQSNIMTLVALKDI